MAARVASVWNGQFPESEKYLSQAELSRKSLKFRRKSDFCQISDSKIWGFRARKIAIPYPQPFHTPTRLSPKNYSHLQIALQLRAENIERRSSSEHVLLNNFRWVTDFCRREEGKVHANFLKCFYKRGISGFWVGFGASISKSIPRTKQLPEGWLWVDSLSVFGVVFSQTLGVVSPLLPVGKKFLRFCLVWCYDLLKTDKNWQTDWSWLKLTKTEWRRGKNRLKLTKNGLKNEGKIN